MSTNNIGGAQFGLTGNPEADAMRYAQANGISLEEAKNQLKSQFGDPQQPAPNSIFGAPSPIIQMQLQNMPQGASLFNFPMPQSGQLQLIPLPQTPEQMFGAQYGIPPEIVAQGDDAIRKYAQDNNISLPAKNTSGTTNTNTNTTTAYTDNTSQTTAKTGNLYENFEKTDNAFDDSYNSFDKYKEISESMNYSSSEKSQIKKETKAYKKQIDAWQDEYHDTLKAQLEEELKSCSSRKERKALKKEFYNTLSAKISQYVEQKFTEQYPNVDFRAVLHNVQESEKGVFSTSYYVPTKVS